MNAAEKKSLKELENQPCPARSEYGCKACSLLNSPVCFGIHMLSSVRRKAVHQKKLESYREKLDGERHKLRNLKRNVCSSEKRVEELQRRISELDAEISKEDLKQEKIQNTDDFKALIKKKTEIRQNRIRGIKVKSGGKGEKVSLCGDCRNCSCSWMRRGEPVDGWTAERSRIYKDGFVVLDCPEFDL